MSLCGVKEPPFLSQLQQDVSVQEEDGSIIQNGTIGCEPCGSGNEGCWVIFAIVIVVISGVEPKIVVFNLKN